MTDAPDDPVDDDREDDDDGDDGDDFESMNLPSGFTLDPSVLRSVMAQMPHLQEQGRRLGEWAAQQAFPGLREAGIQAAAAYSSIMAQAPWFAAMRESVARLSESLFDFLARDRLPPNWAGVTTYPNADELRKIVLDEGLPLAWVPSAGLLTRLLGAPDAAGRRQLISNGWKGILADCDERASEMISFQARTAGRFVRRSVAAFRDGHYESAQALATNLIDTLGNVYVTRDITDGHWKYLTARNSRDHVVESFNLRDFLVLGALWAGHANYRPGDMIPRTFTRHATTHGVSHRQYTRVNALIALMNATALLCWLERDKGAFEPYARDLGQPPRSSG